MKFFDQFSAFYKLYQNGTLDALLEWVKSAKNKKGKIETGLDVLEKSLMVAKTRLGTIQDATVCKSLNINSNIDFANQHISFETVYRVILDGKSPYLVDPAGSGKSTLLEQIAEAMVLEFFPISAKYQKTVFFYGIFILSKFAKTTGVVARCLVFF